MDQQVRRARAAGFTLVELLVVIVVLGVLSGIVVFGVARFRSDATDVACRADVVVVNSAADAYLAATGTYPTSVAELTAGKYLKSAPATGTYAFDPTGRTVGRVPACDAAPAASEAPTTAAPRTPPPATTVPTTARTSAPTTEVQDGVQTAADWKVISGRATLSGTTIDVTVAMETRIVSTRVRTGTDVVFTTTATLRGGSGYGIWARASFDTAAGASGYVLQYDLVYGNTFVLRQWYQGKECTVPLKTAKAAANFVSNSPHTLVVTTADDSLRATIDGVPALDLPGLSAAVAASTCGFPLSDGTGVGFRGWGVGLSLLFTDTTLR